MTEGAFTPHDDPSTPEGTLSAGYDAILADLDGTLIRGTDPIPGASAALEASGLPVVYVTNNASRSPADTASHLRDLGFRVEASDVMTSAQAAVVMLGDHIAPGGRVLVVGHDSFRDLATDAGYTVVLSADDQPEAVLQGLSRELTWGDLAEGCLALRRGVPWIASNVDTTLPTERGLLPGNGSLVAALRAATDRDPHIAGKPAAGVLLAAADQVGSTRPLVVGDRLDTDIQGAVAAGMPALMVLTGVHGVADLLVAPADRRPSHLAEDLRALGEPETASRIDAAPEIDAGPVSPDADGVAPGAGDSGSAPEGPRLEIRSADGEGTALARSVLRAAWRHHAIAVSAADPALRARLEAAGFVVG